ncbi:LuxR family transcriptional regulator [Streptomyces sp. CC77]|uniref:helix-turn-helix transcriptional regulator n=1 Tax=Streptomyces sp. CC77 TaxID=1906739 RepID=UPI0008DD9AFF|nr:LuxR family transcriptional regulator [Streptomyces sp. CC77]OII66403.1 hypothetical protein BJP39_08710 [Streptomyces sp. CC77]
MIQGEWPPLGLGEAEERAYEALLLERAHRVEELARLLGLPPRQVHTALARLVESGLARPAEPPDAGGLPHPTAPETALRTLIHRRQAELHRRSAELARLRLTAERLAEASWTGPGQAARGVGGVEPVTGVRAIAERVGELVAGAGREVLVMDDRPDAAWLDLAAARAAEGVPVRVVLDRAGLGCPAGRRRTAALTGRGLRLRTAAAGVPTRLVAVDDRVALLPPSCGAPGAYALVVAEARLRDALLPLFEAVWSGASPPGRPRQASGSGADRSRPEHEPGGEYGRPQRGPAREGARPEHEPGAHRPQPEHAPGPDRAPPERRPGPDRARRGAEPAPAGPEPAAAGEQQRELLSLLAAGLKDEAIARRLGVHVHTARRRITRLLDALDARTRFQAGARATARGWLQP